MKKTQLGFTLIELLVVIAIIGILASVVLASLGTAKRKSEYAALKATASSVRAQAELDGNFATVCSGVLPDTASTSNAGRLINSAVSQGKAQNSSCYDGSTGYAVSFDLNEDNVNDDFCVNSDGFAGVGTADASFNCN